MLATTEQFIENFTLGARLLGEGRAQFTVWAPLAEECALHVVHPEDKVVPMQPSGDGYFSAELQGAEPGLRYFYRHGGERDLPDPASRFQPEGEHGPSELIDENFAWQCPDWQGLPLEEYIFYEMHIGTFTREGTFEAAIERLPALQELGITAIEVMPIAEFPNDRNWGYEGTYPFAAESSYGGAYGFQKFIDACHAHGIAVVLDVVYNHFGPDGAYFAEFGYYFTDMYKTPWGSAINFDGPHSDEVRRYFIENALYWVRTLRVDALRLDSVQSIFDFSAYPFLEELGATVHREAEASGRRIFVIAESNLNNPRLVMKPEEGGMGLDAHWIDDFHNAMHAQLTGTQEGYYCDFGNIDHLRQVYSQGYYFTGTYCSFLKRRHGRPTGTLLPRQLVVYSRNHDQIGNQMLGERLTTYLDFERLKLAAGIVLLSPFLPLLFMGEEYAETAPFQFFVSHNNPEVIKGIRKGRKEEFAFRKAEREPPDPQDPFTFERSKINFELRLHGHHQKMWNYYKELIRLRKTTPGLSGKVQESMCVETLPGKEVLIVYRACRAGVALTMFNFARKPVVMPFPEREGVWRRVLDSTEEQWGGPHAPEDTGKRWRAGNEFSVPAQGVQIYIPEGEELLGVKECS